MTPFTKYGIVAITITLSLVMLTTTEGVKKPILDHYELHESCLEALNAQVNEELYASLVYMNMAGHFNNPRRARPGFGEFFRHQSQEEYGHAQILIDYINQRNGTLGPVGPELSPINRWDSVEHALEDAVQLEKTVYAKLHHLHNVAEQKCQDWHLIDFVESKFFTEQVESINELYTWLTLVKGTATPDGSLIGEYLIDQQMKKFMKKAKKDEL